METYRIWAEVARSRLSAPKELTVPSKSRGQALPARGLDHCGAFFSDYDPSPSEDGGNLGFTAVPIERRSSPAEKVLCPLLILVGAGDPPHQLGRGDVFELARRHTLAQRL